LLFAGTLAGFIVRGLVPPEVFGAYFFAVTLSGYLNVLNIPLTNLVDIQAPLLIGRGANDEAKQMARDSYSLLGLIVLAEAAVLLIASIWVDRAWLRVSFVVVAIVMAQDAISNVDSHLLRSYRHFAALGIAAILTGIAVLGINVSFAYFWGATGFLVGAVVVSAVRFGLFRAMAWRYTGIGLFARPRVKFVLPYLISTGVVFTVYRMTDLAARTMDRIYVERYLGLEQLGIYSLAAGVGALVQTAASSFTGVVLPTYLRLRGGASLEQSMAATVAFHRSLMALTVIMSLGVIVGAKLFLGRIFPAYTSAVLPTQLLCVSAVLAQGTLVPTLFILGGPSRRPLLAASAVGLAVAALAGFFLVRFGLVGMAGATNLSYLTWSAMLAASVRHLRVRLMITTIVAGGAAAGVLPLSINDNTVWMLAYALGVGGVCLLVVLRTDKRLVTSSGPEDPTPLRPVP
jgi:O-antigen/teichoic acid export membrane protein